VVTVVCYEHIHCVAGQILLVTAGFEASAGVLQYEVITSGLLPCVGFHWFVAKSGTVYSSHLQGPGSSIFRTQRFLSGP
jgi:hypothetical protein